MSNDGHSVKVNLLGREHQFACPPGQEQALLDAAQHLNESVEHMRQRSAVRNDDKALLMAALNLCHELLEAKSQLTEQQKMQSQLCSKLTSALETTS
ncbi:cell division protein ZapA [Pseudoalteromonas sp. MM17-2]|uniref:cell division protein ZapA n=1 Tax=Pseudoalteromonas sp. MM17-2 TaxID=2917753 RepID=UPI001EF5323C|nr:cell division protein ZapA [Pseudoalteromonas sp. MM17-2]MCG7543332.1 cell division protein ZapA [Pseudoalteromonas sp. MM17-2]